MRNSSRLLFFVLFWATFLHAAALNAPAPKFVLNNSHQQKRTLAGYKGKVVFINFWASWCGPCQQELPELNRLAGDYRGKKVKILAINVDTDRKAAKQLLKKLGLANPQLEILWDTQSKAVSAYNIESMPSSFVLDPQGMIRFIHSGFHPQDPAAWRNEIESLLKR